MQRTKLAWARAGTFILMMRFSLCERGAPCFTIGDEKIEAEAGDLLLGPANVPHKYHNLSPGLLESTDIHLSDEWIQTHLEDPELSGA